MSATVLTPDSLKLFLAYANDAGNWSGQPLIGGNVSHGLRENGNLTDLKKHGLLVTYDDGDYAWIEFTLAGVELAESHGVEMPEARAKLSPNGEG